MPYSEVMWRILFDNNGVAEHLIDIQIKSSDAPFISTFHSELVLTTLDPLRVYDSFTLEAGNKPLEVGPGYQLEANRYVIDVDAVTKRCGTDPKIRLRFIERNGTKRIGRLRVYEPKFGLRLLASSIQVIFVAPAPVRGRVYRMFWGGERVWAVGPEPAEVDHAEATMSCSFRADVFPPVGFAYPAKRLDVLSLVFGFLGGVFTSLVASFLYGLWHGGQAATHK